MSMNRLKTWTSSPYFLNFFDHSLFVPGVSKIVNLWPLSACFLLLIPSVRQVFKYGNRHSPRSTGVGIVVRDACKWAELSTKGVFPFDHFGEEFIGKFGGPAIPPPSNGHGINHNGAQGEQQACRDVVHRGSLEE